MHKTSRAIYHPKSKLLHFLIYVKSVNTLIIVKPSNGYQNIMVEHYLSFPKPYLVSDMFYSIYLISEVRY